MIPEAQKLCCRPRQTPKTGRQRIVPSNYQKCDKKANKVTEPCLITFIRKIVCPSVRAKSDAKSEQSREWGALKRTNFVGFRDGLVSFRHKKIYKFPKAFL